MTRVPADQPLIPSVLDRLLDDEPDRQQEPVKSRNQVLRDLKQSVRRDLEDLLNTRWRCAPLPPHLGELETSLVNYGIPDIAGADLGSAERRAEFRATLEAAIRRFEPRFKTLVVELLENAEPSDRMLRFRINALLWVEPAPEPVVFHSAVEPATGNVEVEGASR